MADMANIISNNKVICAIVQTILRRRLLVATIILRKKRKYKKKKCWVSAFLSQRYMKGAYNVTIPELLRNFDLFTNYCRLSRIQFEELLVLIAPKITKKAVLREPIEPTQRLLLTLRYLASGDSMMSLKYQYYIAEPTISKIIRETCEALWTTLMPIVLKVPSRNKWKKIAEAFEMKCQFPHCLGALDGKHVVIQAPAHSGSTYYNYKNSHSIVLMAICDSNFKFILVDIGAEGRQSDGGVWLRSTMGCAFSRGDMDIPPPDRVCEERILPYVLVADEAFQLTNYTMRPFPGNSLTKERKIFNYRLSRPRCKIECTFGILAAQWRIYRRPINTSLETAENIVKATIVLHNFLRKDIYYSSVDISNIENEIASLEISAEALQNINSIGSNTNTREASEIRNSFTTYFNNIGAVPWQEGIV